MSYDIIGDIHGQADKLEALLAKMDYRCIGGVWEHSTRIPIFASDLIDRGTHQRRVIEIVRPMHQRKIALVIMGNHEYNALAFAHEDPEAPGYYLRRHNFNNCRQHAAFLAEYEHDRDEYRSVLDWFYTLPLWIDLPQIRVVHACWHPQYVADIQPMLAPGNTITPELLVAGSRKGSFLYERLETILKGPEIQLPPGHTYRDKDGRERDTVRTRWWDSEAVTYRSAAIMSPKLAEALPDSLIPAHMRFASLTDKLTFIGHYWRTGTPSGLSRHVACVDYSAGSGGPLVAYRWDGEDEICQNNFISTQE